MTYQITEALHLPELKVKANGFTAESAVPLKTQKEHLLLFEIKLIANTNLVFSSNKNNCYYKNNIGNDKM